MKLDKILISPIRMRTFREIKQKLFSRGEVFRTDIDRVRTMVAVSFDFKIRYISRKTRVIRDTRYTASCYVPMAAI